MDKTRFDTANPVTTSTREASTIPVRHALRDQEALWDEFLAMGLAVVDSLSKTVTILCDGHLDMASDVKSLERDSDRAEVRIEQQCLRILALFEPVASDLRRLATILKVSRDWERIADHSARIAHRARKLARQSGGTPIPEALKTLAGDVLTHVCSSYEALSGRDADRARNVIVAEQSIDRQYRSLRRELKESLRRRPAQFDGWLRLMSTARNLERIADHATEIAQTIIYLQEGIIVRHQTDAKSVSE